MEDPSVKYAFRQATIADFDLLLEVALYGFVANEPHSKGLGFTPDEAKPLIEWIVRKSLKEPFSMIVTERATNKIVAFRLYSTGHRDSSKELHPIDFDFTSLPLPVQKLSGMLGNLKKKIWKAVPEAEKVIRQEMSFVDSAHQRKGIASFLLHLGLNVNQLKMDGYHGIQAEATSYANQMVLKKSGYRVMAVSNPKDYLKSDGSRVEMPDETTEMQLCYLPL